MQRGGGFFCVPETIHYDVAGEMGEASYRHALTLYPLTQPS